MYEGLLRTEQLEHPVLGTVFRAKCELCPWVNQSVVSGLEETVLKDADQVHLSVFHQGKKAAQR